MRPHLATFLEDFRKFDRSIAVVRLQGNRRRVTTFGELAGLAGRFGAYLEELGIGSGDRVLLWGENSAEWIAAFYGILLRGALAVPLDAFGTAEFAERVADDVRPKLAVGDAVLLEKLSGAFTRRVDKPRRMNQGSRWAEKVREGSGWPGSDFEDGGGVAVLAEPAPNEFPTLAFEEWATALPAREAKPVTELGHETPLQILFTSGTTGEPKGIVHTHGNVLASVAPIEQGAKPYLRYEWLVHPLRVLHTLPLSHVFGQTMGLWVPAILGAEVHFEQRLVASRLIETIRKEKISVLAAVPRVMGLLKTHLESSLPGLAERVALYKDRKIGAAMRWWRFRDVHRALGLKFWALVSGGGALPGPLEQFWNGLGLVVVQGYGMTETTALITLNHPFHVASGTIGKPLPGREVKIGPDGEVLVRGPMISTTTWSDGRLQLRAGEWLATGDLAEEQATGELRFLGRKSEVIVTAAGVNIHPEDLEAAIEQQPGVKGCAVVSLDTVNGPEPFAVLAVRGSSDIAATAVERANEKLAEFQRVLWWAIWPDPDLPRTSTGKIRRKTVAEWVAKRQTSANGNGRGAHASSATNGDWLLGLVAEVAGEMPANVEDGLRLTEDLHLDSLGRVQLAAALEERLGDLPGDGTIDRVQTLGELRTLARQGLGRSEQGSESWARGSVTDEGREIGTVGALRVAVNEDFDLPGETAHSAERNGQPIGASQTAEGVAREKYVYPRWPWWKPVEWVRTAFLEVVARPLVWFLAGPKVVERSKLAEAEPLLIVCNHITAYDGPLVQYALPWRMRRKIAAAMSGEMLQDFRHFRKPERRPGERGLMLLGPAAYFLATALFNVFPLPRKRNFQRSFAHAGEALDHGYNVLVFPEGARSNSGKMAEFRPGIGLLVKESQAAVLPVALEGLDELVLDKGGWFRSGKIKVHVGEPIRFGATESESAITERLSGEVRRLLEGQ
ncbi:MAG TPA: AMP-binding protein [Terracidiphilus sp.]|jgi:long-chain acyl-CoA synthetase|nr:AMP-binding protein [Terracidiphilus sp.]